MVFNVCNRVLRHHQDAEDAFQATFLVLARNVSAVRNRQALAAWLHRSAYRMALGIRRAADRRRHHEGQSTTMTTREPSVELAWKELQGLHEDEVQRLPEKYRMAFVLCCLEGGSRAEAAGLLGIKEGTISSRIDQARKRLQCRLARRGVTLSAALAAINLTGQTKAFANFGRLFTATARAAALMSVDNGASTAIVGGRVSALVERGTRALLRAKSTVASVLLSAGLAIIGAGVFACQSTADGRELPERTRQSDAGDPKSSPDEKTPSIDADGDPLPNEALARLGTLRFRPGGFVQSVAFAPDAKSLVALGTDGTVSVFDAQNGRTVRRFQCGGIQRRSALSADGRWVVTLAGKSDEPFDPEVSVDRWDCTNGQKSNTFGKGPYVSATFAPDGKTLAILRYDGMVELWESHTGQMLRSLKADDGPGYDLTVTGRFTPDGKIFVTKHRLQGIRSWDVATGRRLHELSDLYMSYLFAVSSRNTLAVDGRDPTTAGATKDSPAEVQVRLLDLAAGKDLPRLAAPIEPGPFGHLTGFARGEFSPDGTLLATAGYDRQIRLWDVATGKQVRSWPYVSSTPGALAFSADAKRLAVADGGMSVRLLDVAGGNEAAISAGNRTGFFQSRFTANGEAILTLCGSDQSVHAWELATGRLRRRREWPADQMARSTFSRDGATILSWSLDGMVRTWDSATGKELRHWKGDFEVPFGQFIVPSADGKTLAFVGQRPTIVLADAITGKELRRLDAHAPWPLGAAFSANGRTLTTWGVDGRARVWDLATGNETRAILFTEAPEPARVPVGGGAVPAAAPEPNSLIIFSAAVSPDGRLLAFGSRRGFIAIHETANGEEVRRLETLPTGVSEMAFSPDGRTLAWSGIDDPSVRLVEIASGKERHVFAGHVGRVKSLTYSADGSKLISGSEDTTALVWDLGPTKSSTSAEREDAWKAMADSDVPRAYRAVRLLASSPDFLGGKLRPVTPVDGARVKQLIADLDSDKFAVRKKANADLERLGDLAGPACRKALALRPSAETRRRLETVLEAIARSSREFGPERLRNARSLEALELSATHEARQILEKLAGGAEGAWLSEEAKAALRRLESEAKR
jgi:RNA polymerase sigma factor (sigma-70 family)